jgi:hypothetical protein
LVINPSEIALSYLIAQGIEFDDVYNDNDGVTRTQLSILVGMKFFTKETKTNLYKTIHRLHASANKKNINFAANIKNTLVGTVSSTLVESLDVKAKEDKGILIRWLPSSADEADPMHSLNYGKIMTMGVAIQKGLGVRYGCQCGMEILHKSDAKKLNNT